MSIAGTTAYEVYNLKNIQNAAGNLSMVISSTMTRAQAMRAGWRDVGHVIGTDITPSVSTSAHKSCRRGVVSTDREFVSDSSLKLGFKCEELRKLLAGLGLCGDETTALTQAIHTSAAGATFAFTKTDLSGGADCWYNLCRSGETVPLRLLSAATYAVPAESVSFDAGTDIFTTSGHLGWANGTRVLLGGTPPAGFTAKDYFVINYTVGETNDTFELADSAGGAQVLGTDTGTNVTVTQQFDEGEQVVTDGRSGRVRFLFPVSQTVTPTLTAPAIDLNNNPEYVFDAVTPMTSLTREGWFRLLLYADGSDTEVIGDYTFSGTLITKGAQGLDGSKAAEFDFEVTVGDDKGTFYIAP